MPMITPSKLKEISEADDPKRAIEDAIGTALDSFEPAPSLLVVGTYISPAKTKGGIYRPESSKMEDLWQGCIGLVLKKGSFCFVDDDVVRFGGFKADVGQWVLFKYSDAWEVHVGGVSCRVVADSSIKAVIGDPLTITPHRYMP